MGLRGNVHSLPNEAFKNPESAVQRDEAEGPPNEQTEPIVNLSSATYVNPNNNGSGFFQPSMDENEEQTRAAGACCVLQPDGDRELTEDEREKVEEQLMQVEQLVTLRVQLAEQYNSFSAQAAQVLKQEGATKANPADDRSHGDAASTTPSVIPANTPSTPIGNNGTKSDPANLLVELEKILAGLDVHVKDLDAELEEQCAKVRAATRELQQARHEITTMADQPAFVHRRDEDVELMHVPSAPMADGDHNAAAARE